MGTSIWYYCVGSSSSTSSPPDLSPSVMSSCSSVSAVVADIIGVGVGVGIGLRMDGSCAGRGCAACVVVFFDGLKAD